MPADVHFRQKYQKIRKRDAAIYGMEDTFDSGLHGSANTKTPRSNKRKTKYVDEDVDDEELMEETPTKKKAKLGKAKGMKKESFEYAESEQTKIKLDSGEEDDLEL